MGFSEMTDTFGQRLATLRKRRGWLQRELADRTGLHPAAISHFETGHRLPSLENLLVLIDALGCSADALLKGLLEE